jgi:prepilin-type N-terminal cleavage/methylation domain-containing protein
MKKGFTLIELLIVIALIGILSAIGIPAYTGYQAKARYNASKTNHANAVSYMTAEIAKCNDRTTPISFISNGRALTHSKTVPVNTMVSMQCPPEQADAVVYFTQYLNENFYSPWRTDDLATIVGSGSWGYMSIWSNSLGITLQTHLGRQDGDRSGGFNDQDHLIAVMPLAD